MRSFFSFSRNRSIILITLLVMLVLGVVYFFVYIPNNQTRIEAQRYRCLQNIERNVHAKIENSAALLNNLLVAYAKETNKSLLEKYIGNYSREAFKIDSLRTLTNKGKGNTIAQADSSLVKTLSSKEVKLSLRKGTYSLQLTYSITQFIASLLPTDVFDQYIVLQHNKIIYQTFPSGITEITPQSLSGDKSASADSPVKNIILGGNTYKLFTQKISLGADNVLTIAGLLSKKKYQNERTKLPENVILLLLVISITGIISLPWIKLYQMGSQDRLTVLDGLFSFAVSMLLMSLLFFAFFKYNVLLRPGEDLSEVARKRLAGRIETAFVAEIESALNVLHQFDNIRKEKDIKYGLVNLGKGDCRPFAATSSALSDSARQFLKKPPGEKQRLDLNQVFWLRGNGTEITNWTSDSVIAPSGTYANREYFKKVRDGQLFELKGMKFYLDQLISWTTGKFTTVVSGPSLNTDASVVAMSFNTSTLDSPVLPVGFLYAVIDNNSRVLYHSRPSKNLNEKLLSEFSAADELKAGLLARNESFFKTKYSGKEYKAYVKPFARLPYHLVILENTEYKNLLDINIFSFSFFTLLLFFLILISELLVVFLFSRRQSFFKKQYFDISWVGPHECFEVQYRQAIGWNLFNMVLLIAFCNFASFLQFLFILLISATSVTLVLNNLYREYYRKTAVEKYKLKRKSEVALWAIIILLNIAAFGFIQSIFNYFLLFEALLMIAGFLFFRFGGKDAKGLLKKKVTWWNYTHSYSFMIFSRLIISSGIPVAFFYISAHNYEYQLMARFRHSVCIGEMQERISDIKASKCRLYTDGVWISSTDSIAMPDTGKLSREGENAARLFSIFSSYSSADLPSINHFDKAPDSSSVRYSRLFGNGTVYTIYNEPAQTFHVSSSDLAYRTPDYTLQGLLYWLLFLSALIAFWQILHRIIRKLFALNLPADTGWEQIDNSLVENNKLNKLLFIIGSPGSGKLTNIKDKISNGRISGKDGAELVYDESNALSNNVLIIDMISIPDSDDDQEANDNWKKIKDKALEGCYSLVVVNHFEYDIKNSATNRIKLNFLESLLQANKAKVIIISTVHPVNFLDSLNQQELIKDQEKRLPEHDLERWHVLLGHFRIVIDRLDISKNALRSHPFAWENDVFIETQYTHFLKNMQEEMLQLPAKMGLNEAEARKLDGDSLVFKLQVSSHYFYMYIWQSLTKEEKFLLYDMAEDGLVNPYDDYNLTLLISKGLIVREHGVLRLFNKGFRNFILTAIGSTEAMKIRKQIKDNGNWGKLKTPLIIVIGAVFAFLFASQQEAYSTIITYLTVLTAAIPAALRFFSLFENNSEKTA